MSVGWGLVLARRHPAQPIREGLQCKVAAGEEGPQSTGQGLASLPVWAAPHPEREERRGQRSDPRPKEVVRLLKV